MNILVFGKNGQVASALAERVEKLDALGELPGGYPAENWVFVSSAEANFEIPESIGQALETFQPVVVINASAFTAVDKAEAEVASAHAINGVAPGVIAQWCAHRGASLLHFSTDYVYSGEGMDPWKETDATAPQNNYGHSKLFGEKLIRESGCHHLILRTSWVYSVHGNNFVKTMLRLGKEKEELKVVNDQIGSPTSADVIAEAVMHLMDQADFRDQELQGIYHLAGRGFTSWHRFATAIFDGVKKLGVPLMVQKVTSISTASYPTPAKRPLNSRLDQSKIKDDFGWESPNWQDSLGLVLEGLCR